MLNPDLILIKSSMFNFIGMTDMKIEFNIPDWLYKVILILALSTTSALAGVFIGFGLSKLLEILGI